MRQRDESRLCSQILLTESTAEHLLGKHLVHGSTCCANRNIGVVQPVDEGDEAQRIRAALNATAIPVRIADADGTYPTVIAASPDFATDGVLVLDVGGSGLTEPALRPFLLRRLRVHPAAWQSTAVLDPGAEAETARLLAKAPAGVVLLAEGWSLSPARMVSLHAWVRACAGPDAPVKFLVANVGTDGQPAAVTTDERREWTRFVDSLRDPAAEVFFFEDA